MKILLDECVPRQVAKAFAEFDTVTVEDAGWLHLKNGLLISKAEQEFDVFITVDSSIPYQQNFRKYDIGFIIIVAINNRVENYSQFRRGCQSKTIGCETWNGYVDSKSAK